MVIEMLTVTEMLQGKVRSLAATAAKGETE
jgi:hypothetical protein